MHQQYVDNRIFKLQIGIANVGQILSLPKNTFKKNLVTIFMFVNR